MKNMYSLIVCGLFILTTANLEAQRQEPLPHPWWVTLGGGAGTVDGSLIMNAGMSYAYQFENSILTGRIAGGTNKNPTVLHYSPSALIYKIADYGVLYGPVWHDNDFMFAVSSGVGLVRIAYENSSDVPLSKTSSISVPFEVQAFWRPTHFMGFGVYGYLTWNFEKTFTGLWLSTQLGMW